MRRTCIFASIVLFFVSLAAAQHTPLRFAWLSDTHVGGTTGAEDLRASVKDINALVAGGGELRFVLLSGDITEYGSCVQLDLAKQILDSLTIPYYILPGNHDTKWSESGATYFPKIFKADRFVFEASGIRFIGMHQGPLMKMGDGHWAPQDVRWIDSILTHLPDPAQPIIFVTHYPLNDGIANWFEVLDRLKKVNTQAVLVGHGHSNQKLNFEGVPGIMGRSNLRAKDTVGGYTIVDVRNDSLIFQVRLPDVRTKAPWYQIALGPHIGVSGTGPRPDFSVNASFPHAAPKWHITTGFTIASTPAISGDLAIVGDASGTVYAIHLKDGSRQWTFHCRDAVYSTPAVANGIVVVASADGAIYALDAAKGTEIWRVQTDKAIVASPMIADGTVYVGASDGRFRALDLKSGALKWEYAKVAGFVETRPLLYEGKVIFGAWDNFLYALDAANGEQAWKWRGDKPGALLSPAACWPIGADGKIFVVAPDRRMTAIDAATGREVWRTADHQVRESIGLSEDAAKFYVRTMEDSVLALATAGTAPRVIWGTNAGFGYDINSAMLVEKDGTVFYGTKNGLMLAMDAATGAILWKHRIGVALLNTVVALSKDEVLVTDFDGTITLLGSR